MLPVLSTNSESSNTQKPCYSNKTYFLREAKLEVLFDCAEGFCRVFSHLDRRGLKVKGVDGGDDGVAQIIINALPLL